MGHIVKKTPRLDIDINIESKNIVVIQRWKYNWIANGFGDWNYIEKKKIHEAFEKEMDRVWNRKASLKVVGSSTFAIEHKNDIFKLFFDIKWAVNNSHWNVDVIKVAPTNFSNRPFVNWNTRQIKLYTVDIQNMTKVGAPTNVSQKNIPHEFGHAIGNSSSITGMHADEYNPSSTFFSDKISIMNVGMELRTRHFDFILQEINTMIANTNFNVSL
ncbi:hypothetical protein EYY60_16815 [Flavobacterium zhairuonense]|uniref:hypothetical protein n=1 Tax=Flavobacterium zhairuonense TaxID=2493631 RepID=UPI0010501E12|nr:hypothetical protein [Flavobacterium zhairuonense]KAF2507617.1 hypothetical protein EYY60_16815 [Flavobacterium zhairuonense]